MIKSSFVVRKFVPKLTIEPDTDLPDLENLSPQQEKALDTKVEKTLEVLEDVLGGLSGLDDEVEGDADADGGEEPGDGGEDEVIEDESG